MPVDRKRYVELTEVADDVIDYLKRAKVKQEEGCVVRELCQTLWNLEFPPEEAGADLDPHVHFSEEQLRLEQPKRR